MSDAALRALMQRVEKMRHRTVLESAGADWTNEARRLAADVARQWRQLSAQSQAMAAGRAFEATPLRWYPSRVANADDQDEGSTAACGETSDRQT